MSALATGGKSESHLKRRYGFNFQWASAWRENEEPKPPDEKALDFLAKNGFDFVRIPCDYRFWTTNFDYLHPYDSILDRIRSIIDACRSRGIHMSLSFHRAPGYCINRNDLERDNLWLDTIAQDGFVFQWEWMARAFRDVPSSRLSFDLVNEPPSIGEYGFNRNRHQKLIRRTVAAIHAIDPTREVVIDGLAGGNLAMPELADLGVTHSCRGYQPMTVSHYLANWWDPGPTLPLPSYPGSWWDGKTWNRAMLVEFYEPWREVEREGSTIHVGEFGCYQKTPNDVALRWLGDLLSVFRQFGWGFALWNFEGPFGIIGHERPGAQFELLDGFLVDRELFDLLLEARVD